ncbi:MAG: ATP-grasp domain-containing protein [Dehalococcoidia bacterium]|nr:ATP-grasp domain-containing protein [Dehalococcoidia bacterium]
MPLKVAIVYNEPVTDIPLIDSGKDESIIGVLEEVVEVKRALLELGHEVEKVPLRLPLESVPDVLSKIRADVVFNLFEGFEDLPQTEPVVARMLEETGIPFTGNPSSALALTLDKAEFKKVLHRAGVSTPDSVVLTPATVDEFNLNFPCIVKPRDDDASQGLSPANVVNNADELQTMVEKVSACFRGNALVEEFIDGREFNASVLGNNELSLVEISEIIYTLPPGWPRLLTYESKWFEDSVYFKETNVCCPAEINSPLRENIAGIVLTSTAAAGCRGYARVDMRQDKDGSIKVLEVNANPDIEPDIGIALQASARGISYPQLIQKIVDIALE